jgi:hypothetical protein
VSNTCSCPPYIDTHRDPRLLSPSPCPAHEDRVTVVQRVCAAELQTRSSHEQQLSAFVSTSIVEWCAHSAGVERSSGGCPPAAILSISLPLSLSLSLSLSLCLTCSINFNLIYTQLTLLSPHRIFFGVSTYCLYHLEGCTSHA